MQVSLAYVPGPKSERKKIKRGPMNLSPEMREAKRQRLLLQWQDPVFREKRLQGTRRFLKTAWQDPEYRAKNLVELRSHEIKRLACSRLHNAKRVEDPEYIERMRANMKGMWENGTLREAVKHQVVTPQGLAARKAAIKRGHDKKRGFAVPKALKAEYDFLVKSKRMLAREAGVILGIIREKPPVLKAVLVYKTPIEIARDEWPSLAILALTEPRGKLMMVDLLNATAKALGLTVGDIISHARFHHLSRARHVVFYIARTLGGRSYPDIGMRCGGRDHTTVMHGVDKVANNYEKFSREISAVLAELGINHG